MSIAIVAGNWKMNTTITDARALVNAMKEGLDAVEGVTKVVCPPFVSLSAVAEMLRGSSVHVGAQNMHHEEKGAYTGEVSPAMLAGICRYVVLGHSERRLHFGETDAGVSLKAGAAIEAGLRPIVCVGESLHDREQGSAEQLVSGQIRASLADVRPSEGLVVAYEPVWAIGTGRAATPDVAQEMMSHIRGELAGLWGRDAADEIPLLYGGSVTPDNITDYMEQPDVNGALVGGASLNADAFVEIVRLAARFSSFSS
jgi:triosephosphate isomerase